MATPVQLSRCAPALLLSALFLAAVVPMAAADLPGEPVTVPGPEVALTGRLLLPDGPGQHPAVVLLHGCGGLYRKGGGLQERDGWWAAELRRQGYVVLLLDSFGPRGVSAICTDNSRQIHPWLQRRSDAGAAFAFLAARPEVRPDRIGLVGWSNGGGTVLATVGAAGAPAYRAAVAFYPGCRYAMRDAGWSPAVPLLVLVGELDDWTPAGPCRTLVARPLSARPELIVYPGAYHDFDWPGMTVRVRTGLATAPGGRAHQGTEPAARADAIEKVTAYLARLLKD